jgi:hypothetical protein
MKTNYIIQELATNREVFRSLLIGLAEAVYFWKPSPDKWCMLEIICHLRDEECEDFRTRIKQVLENPSNTLPPIDPVGWVQERKYLQQDFEQVLNDFLQERDHSVEWLKSLVAPKWDNAYKHPKFGPMSAQLFLSNWLAHDYLHIRQILFLKRGYHEATANEPLDYAGNW